MLKQVALGSFLVAFAVMTFGLSQGHFRNTATVAAVGISNPLVLVTTSVDQINSGGAFSVSVKSPATTQISKLQVTCPAGVTILSLGQDQCGKVQVLNIASSTTYYTAMMSTSSPLSSATFTAEVFSLSADLATVERNVASAYILINPAPVMPPSNNSVSAVLVPNTTDRAGVWSVFGPGRGNTGNRPSDDWKWDVTVSVNSPKTIASIKVTHTKEGGVWSTSESAYYPLVITNTAGQQVNYTYSTSTGMVATSTTKFSVYGQKEQLRYGGGVITVTFTDGTLVSGVISTPAITSVKITHTAEGGIWSTSESAYYPLVVFDATDKKLNTAYSTNLVTLPANAPASAVTATVVPNVDDRAGVWGTFGPGQGNTGLRPATDWKWAVNFYLENGSVVPFTMYGQMERTVYTGGAITVTFADGGVLTATIPAYVPPTITVLSPNGGESFAPGSSVDVQWSSNATSTIPAVGITLVGTAGVTPIRVNLTPGGTPNDGMQTVTIATSTLSGTYKIEVAGTAGGSVSVVDTSDATFSVSVSTPTAPLSLAISMPVSTTTRTILPGTVGFEFAQYIFDARQSGGDIRITSIPLKLTYTGFTGLSLTSCQLFDGVTAVTTGSNIKNPTVPNGGDEVFTFDGTGLIVPKGTIKTISLRCTLSGAVSTGSVAWGLTPNQATYTSATGALSGLVVPETMLASAGQTIFVIAPGSYTVSLNQSLPSSLYHIEKAAAIAVLGAFNFTAGAQEGVMLKQIALKLGSTASSSPSDLVGQQVSLWDGGTQVGIAQFGGANPDYAISTLATPVSIPAGTTKTLLIKGDLTPHDSNTNLYSIPDLGGYGALLSIAYNGAVNGTSGNYAVGQSSGQNISGGTTAVLQSDGFRIFRNVPRFAMVPTAGTLGVNTELYKFTVTNPNTSRDLVLKRVTFSVATSGSAVGRFILLADGAPAGFPVLVHGGVNTEYVTVDFASSSPAKIVSANSTKVYTLVATMLTPYSPAPSQDTISVTLLADRVYPSLSRLMGTVSQIASGVIGLGASASANIIWSPFSTTTPVADTYSESNLDWTNGYGLPGSPGLGQDFPTQVSTRSR
ncbi:MAG: hypothetical protein RLZZ347_585 [Candidatus Parcubacteria bacterium]|jgi:type II secretory pathway pseudopilin PulG